MSNNKKIFLFVVGFLLLSCLTGLAAYGFYKNSNSSGATVQPNSGQKVDPITKQVIDDNADQTPESYGVNPAAPSMIGFAAMLDQGIIQADLTAFQGGISNYFVSAVSTYKPSSVVVLSNASCGFPANDGSVTCTYSLTVNEKTKLQGTLITDEAGHVTITLTNSSGDVVYNTTVTESKS